MDVFFSVDVEIWCDGWHDIDTKFPQAFNRYIYGDTRTGRYGLPYKLQLLQEHGLTGVFFVEPLFAARFGIAPLAEIVGLIREYGHEVQLHMHTEWVDEALTPILQDVAHKRQYLTQFNLDEQITLIDTAKRLIADAGEPTINAFRAGSFSFNRDTIAALAANNIRFDSSYNPTMFGLESGLRPNKILTQPTFYDDVFEYPMTVFNDGKGGLRHAQLGACSFREIEGLLWQALESGRDAFMILSHNFELLMPKQQKVNKPVLKRFKQLCHFLEKNNDCFTTQGFNQLNGSTIDIQPAPLTSPLWKTSLRMLEQLMQRGSA